MFRNCQSIQSIPDNCNIFNLQSNILKNWSAWSTRTFNNAFENCINLSLVNVNLVSSIVDWAGLFKNCINLKDINLSAFIPDYAPNSTVNTSQAFYSCISLPYNQGYKQAIDTKLFNNANIYTITTSMFYNTQYDITKNKS